MAAILGVCCFAQLNQRYFLKVAAVIPTIKPSRAVHGSRIQLGFIEKGNAR